MNRIAKIVQNVFRIECPVPIPFNCLFVNENSYEIKSEDVLSFKYS